MHVTFEIVHLHVGVYVGVWSVFHISSDGLQRIVVGNNLATRQKTFKKNEKSTKRGEKH